MERVEVLIVGGGPAGVTTQLFLAHAAPHLAERTVLVEKERYPREKYCAGGVGARADKLLSSIGVTVDVPSVWLEGVAFRAMGQTCVVREGAIGRVVRRIEFDHELALEARRRGLSLRDGTRVGAIRRVSDGFEVDTNHGTIHARVLIGADGVGSVVRRHFGFSTTRYHAQALEVDTEHVDDDLPRDVLLFDASDRSLPGYYWDFPTIVDGSEMMCRGVYLLKTGASDSKVEIKEVLAEQLKRRGLDLERCRKKRFAERGFEPHVPMSQPGVLLVGEAAGIDPVTGEGIAQAIQYGAVAAGYLARKFEARELEFSDWPDEVKRTMIGRDLWVRTKGVSLFYGAPRPSVERFLLSSPEFIRLGLQHFAGKRWSRTAIARATVAGLGHTARWAWDGAFGEGQARG